METKKPIDDFNEEREIGNERILIEDFLPYKRFFALDKGAYEDGAIPVKYKELMGLSGSLLLRCNDCVFYHLTRCRDFGCSREEINEALNIALVIGGSIIIPHLRTAFEAIDELFDK